MIAQTLFEKARFFLTNLCDCSQGWHHITVALKGRNDEFAYRCCSSK